MNRLVVVAGTGTGVGKTHVTGALVRAWGATGAAVAALKPIETGGSADLDLLGRMSTFHVQRSPSPYMLGRPVSPHLAARMEGRTIEVAEVVRFVANTRALAPVVVELAGGFFTPLAPGVTNAELTAALTPDFVFLVAPDRLGVLHDVGAVTRAAARGTFRGIVLSAPAEPDASTGSNAAELALVTDVPVLAALPRKPIDHLLAAVQPLLTIVQ
jgi:dethiobiotin synthetase